MLLPSVFSVAWPGGPRPTQTGWVVETVDPDYAGQSSSQAVDSKDRPHIAYISSTAGGLPLKVRYATRDLDGTWRIQTLEWSNSSAYGPSIAVDSQDRPWIAYPRGGPANTQWDLRLAHWNGTAWAVQTVEPAGVEAGFWPSLVLDRQDRPRIAYYSNLSGQFLLVYAAWDGTSWAYQTVAPTPWSGTPLWGSISLKLDSIGSPHIAEAVNTGLVYFSWDGARWQTQVLDASFDMCVSLAIDSMDRPHIAYYDSTPDDIEYLHWNGSVWLRETAVSSGSVGWGLSLALDSSDEPQISYAHGDTGGAPAFYLYYVWKAYGSWSLPDLPDASERVEETSLALDSHGLPHISYTRFAVNGTGNELQYAYVPWVDTAPPTSRVLPILPYWNGNPVAATATDESGVANVTLWYRYSGDNLSWGAWIALGILSSPPWTWSFAYPLGDGYYDFYSTAADVAGNAEPPPPAPQAVAGYDATPPASSALPVIPYWHTGPQMTVTATADDALSGVGSVTLLYAYALDNATWGAWTTFGTLTTLPWSWHFPFPDGEGYYRFHTIAQDVAGNVEANKTLAEALAGYRALPDYAPVAPSPASPFTIGLSLPVMYSVEVANLGGDANTTTALAFFNASTPGSPFATLPVSPVPSGGAAGPFAATWVSPGTPGTYAVVAIVDPANALAEPNESNNAYTWMIEVVAGPVTALVVGKPNVTAPLLYVTSATPLSLSVFDPGGTGVRATRYQVDGGGLIGYAASFALPTEGVHVVEWFSEDNAGNREGVRSATVRVDDTPPVTTPSAGGGKYPAGTTFGFTALDAGSGVARTEVRVDGGTWTPYTGPLALAVGDHTIGFRSVDRLNNTEAERTLSLTIAGSPPVPETNWKPLVALVFSIILALVGAGSVRRAPWPRGSRRRLRALLVVVLPFVAAEGATGVVSLMTGLLAIPPLLGAGTAMDLSILVAGVTVSLLRIRMQISSALS